MSKRHGTARPVGSFREGDVVSGKMIIIFATTRNTDLTEGRGTTIDHSYHLSARDAEVGAHGIDVMGSDGGIREVLALQEDQSGRVYLFANNASPVTIKENSEMVANLRKRALSKLSSSERAALGLDD
ncbi:MAG TPA: hypothetical protein PLD99_00330 [Parcubacteria group bacterium]|nr:hypothetical protein [Parcubacteria group bacterium]